eukprot:5510769-Heterocapsa_arctica.AAC.1
MRNSLRLGTAKAEATPRAASRDEEENQEKGCDQKCEGKDATTYQAEAARMNRLSQDRPDIRCANKRACSAMSQPTSKDWTALKKVGRYLGGRPRVRVLYKWQWRLAVIR